MPSFQAINAYKYFSTDSEARYVDSNGTEIEKINTTDADITSLTTIIIVWVGVFMLYVCLSCHAVNRWDKIEIETKRKSKKIFDSLKSNLMSISWMALENTELRNNYNYVGKIPEMELAVKSPNDNSVVIVYQKNAQISKNQPGDESKEHYQEPNESVNKKKTSSEDPSLKIITDFKSDE